MTGLDGFNSLDANHAAAYIRSQGMPTWTLIPSKYADGDLPAQIPTAQPATASL